MRECSIINRIVNSAAVCLLAAACAEESRDPASEAPIDPAAGLYEFSMSGAGMLKHMEAEKVEKPFCLTEIQRSNFPYMLVENRFKLSPYCTSARDPREGNMIAGEVSCMADPKMAAGQNSFVYTGAVGEDRVRVEYQMKFNAELHKGAGGRELSDEQLKFAMKAMERMKFAIEARRIGDCP